MKDNAYLQGCRCEGLQGSQHKIHVPKVLQAMQTQVAGMALWRQIGIAVLVHKGFLYWPEALLGHLSPYSTPSHGLMRQGKLIDRDGLG